MESGGYEKIVENGADPSLSPGSASLLYGNTRPDAAAELQKIYSSYADLGPEKRAVLRAIFDLERAQLDHIQKPTENTSWHLATIAICMNDATYLEGDRQGFEEYYSGLRDKLETVENSGLITPKETNTGTYYSDTGRWCWSLTALGHKALALYEAGIL